MVASLCLSEEILQLPELLQAYIVEQNFDDYTQDDCITWSYLYRRCQERLVRYAHPAIWQGIQRLGISAEQIPSIADISKRLGHCGWKAVPIEGFLPPNIFFLFHYYKILPIERRLRSHDFVLFSPFPDLFHEVIGHCAQIFVPSLRRVLDRFGYLSTVLTLSAKEQADFQTIAKQYSIDENTSHLRGSNHALVAKITEAGAFERLSRLYWWTVENGLVETKGGYLVAGASLLSSETDLLNAVSTNVAKKTLSLACTDSAIALGDKQDEIFFVKSIENFEYVLAAFELKYLKKAS